MTTAVHTYECDALDGKLQDLKQKLNSAFGEQNELPFFIVERFSKYLHKIIQQIASLQVDPLHDDGNNVPYSLELLLQDDELLLGLQWSEEGVTVKYVLQSFNDGSEPLQFIKRLLAATSGSKVSTPGQCSQSAARLTARNGFTRELARMFIQDRGTN